VFTFQPIDLLIVIFAGVVLVSGLSFLILRRRDEMLRDFLTPEEPNIEQEFFKRKPAKEPTKPDETNEEIPKEQNVDNEKPTEQEWGTVDEQ
jgi:hypothetical protein